MMCESWVFPETTKEVTLLAGKWHPSWTADFRVSCSPSCCLLEKLSSLGKKGGSKAGQEVLTKTTALCLRRLQSSEQPLDMIPLTRPITEGNRGLWTSLAA